MNQEQRSEWVKELAVTALGELKAADVKVLDVRELTTVTDWMIVASGRSDRQVRALADNVARYAKERGVRPLGVEGAREGEWVLVDLCDAVVHVMQPAVREFYQLEKLWSGGETEARLTSAGASGVEGRGGTRKP